MKKKKSFIDKRNSSSYHLLHRSQRDIANEILEEGDVAGAGTILWPSVHNNKEIDQKVLYGGKQDRLKEWRAKLSEVGLLEEDPNRYLKPITGTGTFIDASSGRVGSAFAAETESPFAGEEQDEALVEVKLESIPLSTVYMDDDVAEALEGDFEEGDFEEFGDDFILDMAKEPEGDDGTTFDFDEHIRQLMDKARLGRTQQEMTSKKHSYGKQDKDFFAKLKPLREHDAEDDSFADVASVQDFTLTTMPGVVPAISPEEERALCEKFEETLLEYDSDDIGDNQEEEIHGSIPIEGDSHLEAALDDFLHENEDDVLIQANFDRKKKTGGSSFAALVGKRMVAASELDNAMVEQDEEDINEVLAQASERLAQPTERLAPEEIFIDGKSYFSERARNPFDCESIISTYSNLDNNPVTIDVTSRRKKNQKQVFIEEPVEQIKLSNKTGLPMEVLPSRTRVDDEIDGTAESINKGEARSKEETKEEKKIRKKNVKMERMMRRIEKKVACQIFDEELQKHVAVSDDISGKTVFRFN